MKARYDDNAAMLAWVDEAIEREQQQELGDAARHGATYMDEWFGPAGEEARAMHDQYHFNDARGIKALFEAGKGSPELKKFVADEIGMHRFKARKSRSARFAENSELCCVLLSAKRIKRLIKTHYPEERAVVDKAIQLAIARHDDGSDQYKAKVTHARVGDELKRGPSDPKRLV